MMTREQMIDQAVRWEINRAPQSMRALVKGFLLCGALPEQRARICADFRVLSRHPGVQDVLLGLSAPNPPSPAQG